MPSCPPDSSETSMYTVPISDTVREALRSVPTFAAIMRADLADWVELFAAKALDYGDSADDLGVRGQYSDMHRKMRKLKRALWDGETLSGEQPREIILDLISHCFLTLRFLDGART